MPRFIDSYVDEAAVSGVVAGAVNDAAGAMYELSKTAGWSVALRA
jgi:hypothetical protein